MSIGSYVTIRKNQHDWHKNETPGAFGLRVVSQGSSADVTNQMPEGGIEPPRVYGPPDFESGASTNFTTPANGDCIIFSACAVKYFPKLDPALRIEVSTRRNGVRFRECIDSVFDWSPATKPGTKLRLDVKVLLFLLVRGCHTSVGFGYLDLSEVEKFIDIEAHRLSAIENLTKHFRTHHCQSCQ